MAESIGSTLGTISAKVSAVPDALSRNSFLQTAEREGKSFVREGKIVAREIKRSVSKSAKRGASRATTAAKRVFRPTPVKKKTARRTRRNK
jgi:hypothetical protein